MLQLDDWVLCRLYNKKNNFSEVVPKTEAASTAETMDSFEANEDMGSDSLRTPESDVDNDSTFTELDHQTTNKGYYPSLTLDSEQAPRADATLSYQTGEYNIKEDNAWFTDLNLEDLQNSLAAFGSMPMPDMAYQDNFFSGLYSPQLKPGQMNMLPF